MQFIHEIIQLTCVLFHYGKFRLGICFKCVTKIIFGSLELVCFFFFSPPHGPQKVRNDVLLLEQIDEAAGMCFQPSYINRSVL